MVAALYAIYLCKREPAVRGLCDDLIKPITTATLCILTDVLLMTNSMQRFLQSSRLNFVEIPKEKLIEKLKAKYDSPSSPETPYFGKFESFLDIASQSSRECYNSHSNIEFDETSFEDKVIKPFITKLIEEIEVAFDIPGHLMGFTAMDPTVMPAQEEALANYGKEEIAALANFYGCPSLGKPLLDPDKLIGEYKGFKKFVFKKRLEWETKHESDLETAEAHLNAKEKKKASLSSIYSKQKIPTLDKNIKSLKTEIEKLSKTKDYSFEVMPKEWPESGCAACHPVITGILNLAALIPPSTAEVERTFSLMKLIFTKLINMLSQENLGTCIRIYKFRELTEKYFRSIMEKWLKDDDMKLKKRRVLTRLDSANT